MKKEDLIIGAHYDILGGDEKWRLGHFNWHYKPVWFPENCWDYEFCFTDEDWEGKVVSMNRPPPEDKNEKSAIHEHVFAEATNRMYANEKY